MVKQKQNNEDIHRTFGSKSLEGNYAACIDENGRNEDRVKHQGNKRTEDSTGWSSSLKEVEGGR